MEKIKVFFQSNWKTIIIVLGLIILLTVLFGIILGCLKTKSISVTTSATIDYQLDEIIMEQNEQQESKVEEEKELESVRADKYDKATNTAKFFIQVNYVANVVTIYQKDDNNEYTIPVKAMLCSCGDATPTSGVYKMTARYRWLSLFGGVSGQYCSRIVGHILFHSVPYTEKGNPGSLEYWEYDKLGTKASAGCVRLQVSDALWIYNNCGAGTKVEFYGSTNPGPLGKPTAKKISNKPDLVRNWDPTDPSSNNPWKTYKENQQEETNNVTTIPSKENEKESEENRNQEPEKEPEKEADKSAESNKENNIVEENKIDENNTDNNTRTIETNIKE